MKRARVSNLANAEYLSPDDIRYSQDTISATFSNGKPIGKTLDALVRMETFVPEIPPICVAKENGTFYTRNNRRLWVYKQLASMNRCHFIPCFKAPYVPRGQFTTVIGGHEIIVRGDPQSETLEEFNTHKRREMLKRIRSRQISDHTPRGHFTPRFEFMRDQKRRKVTARRKLKHKSEDKKEKGTLKEQNNEVNDIIKPSNKQDDTDEIQPAKARKIKDDDKSSRDRESDEKTQCNKENDIPLKHTTNTTDKKAVAKEFDSKKHLSAKVETNFTVCKDLENKEGRDNVVIDLTDDDDQDNACTIDVKLHDKDKENTKCSSDLFKFSAKSNASSLPVRISANFKSHKIKKERGRSYASGSRNRPRQLQQCREVGRGNPSAHYTAPQFSNNQISNYHSNKFDQPQQVNIIPARHDSQREYLQNYDQNRFNRPEYTLSDRYLVVPYQPLAVPVIYGQNQKPVIYGQNQNPVIYGQNQNVSASHDFQMFGDYRH
ncbi:uncharacterized protein LOC132721665 [Ruditapes philippinarum]|uniref:uncharacterized protein LOC132721665 n=1 Tax=Ruditapes philippinarum TaxID=129788 RepID=UPI00295B6445|nr:uncharacterized protein LOC132721665 [Ruditapes philippinarum]